MTVTLIGQFDRKVRKDERIQKLEKMRENGAFAIDTEKYLKELDTLHESRLYRSYTMKEVLASSQRKLLSANMQNTAYRSRTVAIKNRCYRAMRDIEQNIEDTTNYLVSTYLSELRHDFTTGKARDQALKNVLKDFYRLVRKLTTVISVCDEMIKDFEATGWSINRDISILAVSTQKERNI